MDGGRERRKNADVARVLPLSTGATGCVECAGQSLERDLRGFGRGAIGGGGPWFEAGVAGPSVGLVTMCDAFARRRVGVVSPEVLLDGQQKNDIEVVGCGTESSERDRGAVVNRRWSLGCAGTEGGDEVVEPVEVGLFEPGRLVSAFAVS
jgi:hypothetical protein